ncbi:hypothetical protein [Deinococcus gobiensis]|uniref:DUF3168 domain-containing protein n=1 Tax=Deinococcus gobiensis (strain DSM 21396 / JCM 16679 / CGMCC 1.7299 / I-0) TaxID=745776 RepID=H8H2I7_DEIGI|nr:hypothetical protein [Deinococcus gobiensis]AFD27734.1 hypothetical protein DGo_PB0465 [Deinococcus gobiensis I-0]
MTLDQLLLDLGLKLARDEAGAVASHLLPNPLPAAGTLYAVVSETSDSLVRQGHGYQERRRLVLVMVYNGLPTMAGRDQVELVLSNLRRRATTEVDRWPRLRLQSLRLADAAPVTYASNSRTHYGGQRLALTYIQSLAPMPKES